MRRSAAKYRIEYSVSAIRMDGDGFYEVPAGVARNRRERDEWLATRFPVIIRRHKVVSLPSIKLRYPR